MDDPTQDASDQIANLVISLMAELIEDYEWTRADLVNLIGDSEALVGVREGP